MATKTELLKEPILPNKGAAGVKVGASAQTVKALWGEPMEIKQIGRDSVCWPYESVWFWLKADKVDQIAVYAGYEGRTRKGKVGIGSERAEIEEVYGPLEWDGCWLINCPPFGIGFDFGDPLVGMPRVTGVYIFRE